MFLWETPWPEGVLGKFEGMFGVGVKGLKAGEVSASGSIGWVKERCIGEVGMATCLSLLRIPCPFGNERLEHVISGAVVPDLRQELLPVEYQSQHFNFQRFLRG